MGFGFLEQVYQECLGYEFEDQGVPFVEKSEMKLRYKERQLRSVYVLDFACYGKTILEIKGIRDLDDSHRAQILNYLQGTKLKLGLLVNFGNRSRLEFERIVL